MKTILFITDMHTGAHVIEISGVFERAVKYGWRVIEIERDRTTRPLKEFFETWMPAGCIMECGKLTEPPDLGITGIPVVYIDPPEPLNSSSCRAVVNDAAALAKLAAKELVSAGCRSFAYVGWCEKTHWSVSRGLAFAHEVSKSGCTCDIWDEPWHDTFFIQKKLAKWLAKRKGRCGVFAANDYAAEQVTGACSLASLECPRDIAIVGVDNDELLCENVIPTLTSIEPDFKEAGRQAADLLASSMAGEASASEKRMFGPLSIHRRQSTRLVNSNDIRIIRAVERIRRDACTGLKAADIVAGTGLSRRLAEKRFFSATGRTILGEIAEVRFEMACKLLRDVSIPIGFMAERCGMGSDSYFKRFFKARTGMTPREWRRAQTGMSG